MNDRALKVHRNWLIILAMTFGFLMLALRVVWTNATVLDVLYWCVLVTVSAVILKVSFSFESFQMKLNKEISELKYRIRRTELAVVDERRWAEQFALALVQSEMNCGVGSFSSSSQREFKEGFMRYAMQSHARRLHELHTKVVSIQETFINCWLEREEFQAANEEFRKEKGEYWVLADHFEQCSRPKRASWKVDLPPDLQREDDDI